MNEALDAAWARIGRFLSRAMVDPLVGRKDVSPRLESAIERGGRLARQAVDSALSRRARSRERGRPRKLAEQAERCAAFVRLVEQYQDRLHTNGFDRDVSKLVGALAKQAWGVEIVSTDAKRKLLATLRDQAPRQETARALALLELYGS